MEQKKLGRRDLVKLGSREFAYLGDSVYEMNVRRRLLLEKAGNVAKLNRLSEKFVSAKAQADIFSKIYDRLTKEEQAVARRGRNSRIRHPSKSVDIRTYRKATALECVFGYLMLSGREDRIEELSDMIFDTVRRGKE